MFNILSVVFKYVFILIIYLFMLSIIRLIYLDIKGMSLNTLSKNNYLKLINQKETLPFKVKEVYSLDKDTTIGRGNQNNIIIKDPYISKKHLKIVKDEGDYYLEDLESANGTFVNGDKIMDVVKLRNGDRIRLGQVEFLFVNRK
ncbi:FHA domain-containing protein [Anaerosalibacter bizertensis]|uniref:FHA domain-containing protein n=1 Tax=Anaerosalibacter bizertensis TaxID=932217 RepID=A0A844FB29_9FIRM|nr:FHA domain-containing protein [Anaerosalibacter bizertensis]MBV1818275.1 FHA domain-containing protein [Bacteroidales bacterium MSK.15.36]HHV26377.1 FHA domain-containing protein [Tissierellia bacterium]MBU5294672.1 FHA domain-containing protein [Anaerosalibacter bizertensis]MCB5560366.1 FHA domain-containing protein [Anaerosalibacter bizertensis]MCG4565631.1 FHA domain-containing protein [Anaerosalibacter bizertensis]